MGLKDIFMFILVVGITVFIILWQRSKKEATANKQTVQLPQEENQVNIPVEKIPYIRKNLMTKVDIEKGLSKSEWQTAFNRINKKHIELYTLQA